MTHTPDEPGRGVGIGDPPLLDRSNVIETEPIRSLFRLLTVLIHYDV